MELDSRIIKGKTYLDCYDTEIAKEFIGKECYLSNGVASFANIDNLNKATLIKVDDGDIYLYKLENTRWHYESLFILPCEWVKEEEEKKYRPYTLDEFIKVFNVGDVLTIRIKRTNYTATLIYNGYSKSNLGACIHLGSDKFTLARLFIEFEFSEGCGSDEIWHPFGIEEIEKIEKIEEYE